MEYLTLGITLALLTTFLSALGIVLQKRAHLSAPVGGVHRSLQWASGLCCMAVSALLSLAVSYFLGQQLASCMAAITIVWSLLLRRSLLKEGVHLHDYGVCALLALGVALVLALGSPRRGPAPQPPPDPRLQLALALSTPTAQATLAAYLAALALLLALHATRWVTRPTALAPLLLLLSALASAATGVLTNSLGTLLASAVTASSTLVFFCAAFYASLLGLVLSLVAQVYFLNAALAIAQAALVTPIYQALFVLCGVASGALIIGEGAARTPAQAGALAAGLLCMLAALALLMACHREQGAAQPEAALQQGQVEVVFTPGTVGLRKRASSAPTLPALQRLASEVPPHATTGSM